MINKKVLISGGIVVLLGTSLLTSATYASGGSNNDSKSESKRMVGGSIAKDDSSKIKEMQDIQSKLTTTVTNLDNGVQITQTTSDPGALAFLNKQYERYNSLTGTVNKKEEPNVTRTITKLNNGIQTVETSTIATEVTKLQQRAANMKAGYPNKMDKSRVENKNKKSGNTGVVNPPKIDIAIVNLSNGVEVTKTSSDIGAISKLLSEADKRISTPQKSNPNFQETIVKLSNGFKVTKTSADAKVIKRLQTEAAKLSTVKHKGENKKR